MNLVKIKSTCASKDILKYNISENTTHRMEEICINRRVKDLNPFGRMSCNLEKKLHIYAQLKDE